MQSSYRARLIFLIASFFSSYAYGTDVFVRAGDETGHGHLRVVRGECYAIAPKHLVEPGDITVVRFGGAQSSAVVVFRDSSDIAILRVVNRSLCNGISNPRLEGVSSLLETEISGQIQSIDENGDRTRFDVELTAVGRRQIDIKSRSIIAKSTSGSTLVVSGKPVGMIIRSEGTKAYAYPMAFVQTVWESFRGEVPSCDNGCEVALGKLARITQKENRETSGLTLYRRVDSVYQLPENWPTQPFFHIIQQQYITSVAGMPPITEGLQITSFAFSDSSTPFAQDFFIGALAFEVTGEVMSSNTWKSKVWAIRITGSSNIADIVVSVKPVKLPFQE